MSCWPTREAVGKNWRGGTSLYPEPNRRDYRWELLPGDWFAPLYFNDQASDFSTQLWEKHSAGVYYWNCLRGLTGSALKGS